MMAELATAVVLLNAGVDMQTAETVFQSHGFQTEVVVGGSLLITAEAEHFQQEFATDVHQRPDGAFFGAQGGESRALSEQALPIELRGMVQAIEFQAPPDFGPGNF